MKLKKITSLLAAAALTCAMGTTAFAEDGVGTGNYNADVKGTYQAGGSGAVVYSVDITWEDMSFTYTAAGQGTWDPENHSYTGGSEASWSSSKNITVTNHSNAAVTATAAFQADTGYTDVTMTFGENNGNTIATAVGTQVGEAPSATITVTPGGTLAESADGGKIGTITVSIAAAE